MIQFRFINTLHSVDASFVTETCYTETPHQAVQEILDRELRYNKIQSREKRD